MSAIALPATLSTLLSSVPLIWIFASGTSVSPLEYWPTPSISRAQPLDSRATAASSATCPRQLFPDIGFTHPRHSWSALIVGLRHRSVVQFADIVPVPLVGSTPQSVPDP